MPERKFPVLLSGRKPTDPLTVPWSIAERAYYFYSKRHGMDQSLERLAERGGFGISELDEYVPSWRDEMAQSEESPNV